LSLSLNKLKKLFEKFDKGPIPEKNSLAKRLCKINFINSLVSFSWFFNDSQVDNWCIQNDTWKIDLAYDWKGRSCWRSSLRWRWGLGLGCWFWIIVFRTVQFLSICRFWSQRKLYKFDGEFYAEISRWNACVSKWIFTLHAPWYRWLKWINGKESWMSASEDWNYCRN